MSFGVVVGHISAKIVAIAKNTSKMAIFAKKIGLRRIFYGRRIF